jgi:hypothetical protein
MKRILMALVLLATVACESSRTIPTKQQPQGEEIKCVGLMRTPARRPEIEYDYSLQNIVVGVVFIQSLWVPAVVVLKELECPVRDTTITK